ncbi:protein spaetzle-like, partial [Aphidius gifuensis]
MEIDNSYNLCSSKIQLLRPVKVLSEKKTWELVLNNAEFEQAIRVKICKAPEKPCNWPSQPNYKSWCHQEYSSRILYSVRLDGT